MNARDGGAAPVAAVAAIAAVWLALEPGTADMAAHAYRAWLWDTEGFAVWNAQWYGGHHVPGYSLLFPPLAALLGPWLAVALAGAFAAATLTTLTREWRLIPAYGGAGATHRAAAWLVASGAATNVLVGRGPFVLGAGFGALALVLAGRRRSAAAALAALAAVWSSPVAGLFLALALAAQLAVTVERRTPRATPSQPVFRSAAAAALAAILAGGALMTLPFPEGGTERFVATAFWPMLAVTLAAAALIDPRHRAIRLAASAYALLLVAAFVFDTPVGQNATRLGTLAGPAVLALAGRGPRVALVITGAALLYLQWLPAVRAIDEARNDPATEAAFHQPLIDFLDAGADPGDRVEIPLTRNHWEATHVAKRWALARGWERQLDLKYNGLFYDDRPLTEQRYEAWLEDEGIRWIAVPAGVPLDFSATREAELIASRPPFLSAPKRAGAWSVYEYAHHEPEPITAITPASVTIEVTRPGTYRLTRRFTPFWRVARGRACVRRAPGNRTEIEASQAGRIRLEARVSGHTCR